MGMSFPPEFAAFSQMDKEMRHDVYAPCASGEAVGPRRVIVWPIRPQL